ncbi:hypothetical protein [Nostoc sp. FACHB-145]|uniref:hypothetical protein n=1 Tax=Nostoc sp. FACHB-145 TaxID=2692836 RepID=UPI001685CD9F|nr:hypothetical protein [Nostoc sp. FACHB-145]MBD2467862.1 hypothetical protein [Nostoc sp. FACHB-145]
MTTNNDNTIIAFLLALQDLNTSLSTQDKQKLKEVAKQLDTQPKAWETYIKERLLNIIFANTELNQSYKFYQSKLEKIEEIPDDLLPTIDEISSLNPHEKVVITKGFKQKSEAIGYESQLNNVVITISNAEKPEEIVKKAKFLEKLKQYLAQFNSAN